MITEAIGNTPTITAKPRRRRNPAASAAASAGVPRGRVGTTGRPDLVFGGLIGALGAASRDDWTLFVSALLVSLVCASAAYGGPAGAWFISGLGSAVVLFGCAGVTLYQRRTR